MHRMAPFCLLIDPLTCQKLLVSTTLAQIMFVEELTAIGSAKT